MCYQSFCWIKKHTVLTVLLVLWVGMLLVPPTVLTAVRVDFADSGYERAEQLKVLTSRSDTTIPFSGLRTTYGKTGQSRIYFFDPIYRKGSYIRRLDPIDTEYEEPLGIRSITITCNGVKSFNLTGEEILTYFTLNDQVEVADSSPKVLTLTITGGDSQLFPTAEFRERYVRTARQSARLGVLFLGMVGAVFYGLSLIYGKIRKTPPENRWMDRADMCLILVAACTLILMTLTAFYGDHRLNPDEWESRDAVRYYEEHNVPPDVRDGDVSTTIGTYGTTRLSEKTPYYLYAGKLACLVNLPHEERLFGLSLGFLLFGLVIWNLRKNRYLTAVAFLTPQVWYLFSYGTSDALDYLMAVLVLYQLTKPDSMLHGMLRRKFSPKELWRYLLVGLLFGHILTAKANYYVILIYAFFMLLIPLAQAEKAERKGLFGKYCLILLFTALLPAARLGFDFWHYGLEKSRIILEMRGQRAIHELNPLMDKSGWNWYFHMREQGVSFRDFLMNYGLFGSLFRSFTGLYGGMKIQTPGRYYLVMGGLYVVLYLMTGYAVRKNGGKTGIWKWLLLHGTAAVSLLLVFYNAYCVDFQPQGRYLFPVLIFMAHGISLDGKLTKTRWYNQLLCMTALLGLYSFAAGVPQIWQL